MTAIDASLMRLLRIAVLVAIAVLGSGAGAACAKETTALASKLQKLYQIAFDEALMRHAHEERDGTTYVSTGDIPAEWLRDASAVMEPYIELSRTDESVAEMLRGVVVRQGRYILLDPYANAFGQNYSVVERKFEVDSLLYPIWFATRYWRATGDRSIFTGEVNRAFERVLGVLRDEQQHGRRSHYTHPDLPNGGHGAPIRYTGLIWTGFRPSDDAARYPFNIPENMFAVVVLRELTAVEREVYHNRRDAMNAWGLSVQIRTAVERHGVVDAPGFGRMYAYEVDGLGHANLMDDANVPSLLSIPYFGYLPAHNAVYAATRRFVLSSRNPFYYVGKYARGIGSPHTPRGYVWPLALVIQALTSDDESEVRRVLGYIAASDIGDHRLHESFDADWPEQYTRGDFAWPNALYAKLVMQRADEADNTR